MTSNRLAIALIPAVMLSACSNDVAPTGADVTVVDQVSAPALDRAPRATRLKNDPRYGPTMAGVESLMEKYPEATNVRIDLDGVLGGAYEEEMINHQDHTLRRIDGDADFKVGYTIVVSDLKLVADNEAVMAIGMVRATESLDVTDDLYEVAVVRDSDDVWAVKSFIHKGHFDGELVQGR